MNVVLKRLTELTGKLTWAAGVDPNTLAETRKMVAASLILEDPASRPVTTEPGVEPEIWEAAESGGALADRFAARAQRLRFVREEYLAINSAAEAPVRVFGPFIDSDCALIQFSFYASTDLVSVIATRSVGGFFEISETVLLVPQGTAAGDNAASFTLPLERCGSAPISWRPALRGLRRCASPVASSPSTAPPRCPRSPAPSCFRTAPPGLSRCGPSSRHRRHPAVPTVTRWPSGCPQRCASTAAVRR